MDSVQRVYGWELCKVFRKHMRELRNQGIGYVVGVERGGAIPGVMASHILEVPYVGIGVSAYIGQERKAQPEITRELFVEDFTAMAKCSHILIVDDIYDSGKTLDVVREFLYERINTFAPGTKAKIIAHVLLSRKPLECIEKGVSFSRTVSEDTWAVFPWEEHIMTREL